MTRSTFTILCTRHPLSSSRLRNSIPIKQPHSALPSPATGNPYSVFWILHINKIIQYMTFRLASLP